MPSSWRKSMVQITDDTMRILREYRGSCADGKNYLWTEVFAKANKAILNLVRITEILKVIRTIRLSDGVYIYTLPDDYLRLIRVGIDGFNGIALWPKSMGGIDYTGYSVADTEGEPICFYRDILKYNQIGVIPAASADGSDFTIASVYGALRAIRDETPEYLPYDNDYALRTIDGVPFVRSGDGEIIRSVISPVGNLQVTYVRRPIEPGIMGYPDDEIPYYIHKDIKYGAAVEILKMNPTSRYEFFRMKWNQALMNLKSNCFHKGQSEEATPI